MPLNRLLRKNIPVDKTSCLRCGNCCTRFGVCVTPENAKRISQAAGMKMGEFLDLVPEPPEREREEPAILIDDEPCLLVLKRKVDDICLFYNGKGCKIYESRPMLCRSYPYKVLGLGSSVLSEMKSRACAGCWHPVGKEKKQYLADCKRYQRDVEDYRILAKEWNKRGGTFQEFLASIITNK